MDLLLGLCPPVVHAKMDTLLDPPTDTTDVEKISRTLDRLFARLPIPERLKQHLTMLERLSQPLATVIAKIHQTSGLPDKLASREVRNSTR